MTIISLYINSRDRDVVKSNSSTDFTVNLRKTLKNINQVNITNICIPNTIYTINSNNNVLDIVYGIRDVAEYPHSIKIPEGNYTNHELASEIEDIFNNQIDKNSYNAGTKFYVYYNENTNVFTIVAKIGESESYSTDDLIGNTVRLIIRETELSNMLGIGDNTKAEYLYQVDNVNLTGGPVSLTVTAERQADLNPVKTFYITSKVLTDSINTSYVESLKKRIEITDENNVIDFITIRNGIEYSDSRRIIKGTYTYETLALVINASTTRSETWEPPADTFVVLNAEFKNDRMFISPYNDGIEVKWLQTSTFSPVIGFDRLSEDFKSVLEGDILDLSGVNNVIAKINEHPINGIIRSNNNTIEERRYRPGLAIDYIDIQLRNEYDAIVDNGNVDWSFTVAVTIN